MTKGVAIAVIVVLVVVVGVLAGLYAQKTGKVNSLQADLGSAEAQVASVTAELQSAEAQVSALEGEVESAEAEVATLEASLEAQQGVNSVLSQELKKVKSPRHFASVQELADWLYQDDTDVAFRTETGDNRSYILMVRALRDGYILPAFSVDSDGDYITDYGGNQAHIGAEMYYVWAGDDVTWLDQYVITVPTYPLPLEE